MRPRIRSLKPEMWSDEKISGLTRDARLCLVGLITMADDEGRFRARRSEIAGWVFPGDDDAFGHLAAWVKEIQDSGLVLFYLKDNVPYGAFRNWKKHQKVNRATPSELPPPPDTKVVRSNRVKLTERSRSGHGVVTDSSVSGHYSPGDSDPIRSAVVRLSEQLAGRVRANDPKARPEPHSERWLSDMRLLLKDRDGDEAEVERIIDWCQADSFWRSNILSPGKLRKQFTQLVLKAESNVTPIRGSGRPSAGDLLRKINAAEAARGGAT